MSYVPLALLLAQKLSLLIVRWLQWPMACLAAAFVVLILVSGCASQAPKPAMVQKYERALEYYRQSRFTDAEALFQQIVQAHPDHVDTWFRLGNLYVRTGQNEAAVYAFTQCLKRNPQYSKAWHNLALVHVKQAVAVLEEGMTHLSVNAPERASFERVRDALGGVSVVNEKALRPVLDQPSPPLSGDAPGVPNSPPGARRGQ